MRKGPTQLPIRVTRRPPTVGARRLRPVKSHLRPPGGRRGPGGAREGVGGWRAASRHSKPSGRPPAGRPRNGALGAAGARSTGRRREKSVRPPIRVPPTASRPEKVQVRCRCAAARLEKPLGDRKRWWPSAAATRRPRPIFWLGRSLGPPRRSQSSLGAGGGREVPNAHNPMPSGRARPLWPRLFFNH